MVICADCGLLRVQLCQDVANSLSPPPLDVLNIISIVFAPLCFFQAVLRRLSVHECHGGRMQTPRAVIIEEILRTSQCIVKSLHEWLAHQCNPLTASPMATLWQEITKDEFLSMACSMSLSIIQSALPWPLVNQSLTWPVSSVLVTLVQFLRCLKTSLIPSQSSLSAQQSEVGLGFFVTSVRIVC